MIIEKVFDFAFLGIINAIDNFIPYFEFTLPDSILTNFLSILRSVDYFVPLNILFPIVIVSFSLDIAWIIWALIIRIKSFIPFMGA